MKMIFVPIDWSMLNVAAMPFSHGVLYVVGGAGMPAMGGGV